MAEGLGLRSLIEVLIGDMPAGEVLLAVEAQTVWVFRRVGLCRGEAQRAVDC